MNIGIGGVQVKSGGKCIADFTPSNAFHGAAGKPGERMVCASDHVAH